jgi:hypothetical protein
MPHSDTFVEFLRKCDEAARENSRTVVIDDPYALGDGPAELVEGLSRLADAGLCLRILRPADRRLG